MDDTKTGKKLRLSILAVIVLIFCLGITTFALVDETVSLENNLFQTGSIKINLNDGNPVIREDEFLFEPGMTVEKTFFIENQSTWDVYYKIYLEDIAGGLADVLQVTVKDGDEIICKGTPDQLKKKTVMTAKQELRMKQRKTLTITFYFPPDAGNGVQNRDLTFTICADATQTKNNPNRAFNSDG